MLPAAPKAGIRVGREISIRSRNRLHIPNEVHTTALKGILSIRKDLIKAGNL
jgi:hypothetical protein